MKPSEKSPEMEKFIDETSKNLFGNKRTDSIENNKCVMCGRNANEFRNPISAKEFTISGMCQKCQDDTFGKD